MTRGRGALRILVVDDHALLRAGLQALLKGRDGFQVVGRADPDVGRSLVSRRGSSSGRARSLARSTRVVSPRAQPRCRRRWSAGFPRLHAHQLDFENERSIWPDIAARSARAVSEV